MNINQLFIIGAIVLVVLAIIASASNNLQSLGVNWDTWLSASLLSFFAAMFLDSPIVIWKRRK